MKRSNFKFGSNILINLSILAFHFFGVWPRKHSTLIHTVVDYSCQILCSGGWTIAKCISTRMLEHQIDLISLGSSSIYYTMRCLHLIKVLYNLKNIQKRCNRIREFELSYRESQYTQENIQENLINPVALYVVFAFSALGLAAPCICSISVKYLLESVY